MGQFIHDASESQGVMKLVKTFFYAKHLIECIFDDAVFYEALAFHDGK